jgi:hypothetical protein
MEGKKHLGEGEAMKERFKDTRERLGQFLAKGSTPDGKAAPPGRRLESVDGILQSAATLGKVVFAYWAIQSARELWNSAKEGVKDAQRDARNEARATRDLADTKRRQDEKDTQEIEKGVGQDFIDRERKKLLPIPKSVRGHWEGHVFIPKDSPAKPSKQSKRRSP